MQLERRIKCHKRYKRIKQQIVETTVKAVAEKSGILRETLLARFGKGEFTASKYIVVKCSEFIQQNEMIFFCVKAECNATKIEKAR